MIKKIVSLLSLVLTVVWILSSAVEQAQARKPEINVAPLQAPIVEKRLERTHQILPCRDDVSHTWPHVLGVKHQRSVEPPPRGSVRVAVLLREHGHPPMVGGSIPSQPAGG